MELQVAGDVTLPLIREHMNDCQVSMNWGEACPPVAHCHAPRSRTRDQFVSPTLCPPGLPKLHFQPKSVITYCCITSKLRIIKRIYEIKIISIISNKHINTLKYHVSCTDGKISVRINLFLLSIFPPQSHSVGGFFFRVGLSLLSQHSQKVLCVEVSSVLQLQHPTRPAENVITTKGLQERKTPLLLNGTTVQKQLIKIN